MSKPSFHTKQDELLKFLLSDRAKPSGVVDHKLDDKGLQLTLRIPREKVGTVAPELLALLMSDAM